MDTIKLVDLIAAKGLLCCPHCRNANRLMVFASFHDLQIHVRHGCMSYRYRRN